jgi:hypothetical protein
MPRGFSTYTHPRLTCGAFTDKEPTPHARSKDTFLTALYVMVDDFCHSQPPKGRPGSQASLSNSEVITLAIFARWGRFASERDF